MRRPKEINYELKKVGISLSEYVRQLEVENLRLHKYIAKLSVRNVSQQNEIAALKKSKPPLKIVIQKYASIGK